MKGLFDSEPMLILQHGVNRHGQSVDPLKIVSSNTAYKMWAKWKSGDTCEDLAKQHGLGVEVTKSIVRAYHERHRKTSDVSYADFETLDKEVMDGDR